MSETYKKTPSEILGINDEYTAFCFDEACAYILNELKQDKKPNWSDTKEEKIEDGLQYLLSLQKNL